MYGRCLDYRQNLSALSGETGQWRDAHGLSGENSIKGTPRSTGLGSLFNGDASRRCGSRTNPGLQNELRRWDGELFWASRFGSVKMGKYCVDNGADVDFRGTGGRTPLIESAAFGQLGFLEMLLEHGANIHLEDQSGSNALINAASAGHADIVKRLLSEGAQPNSQALQLACANGHLPVVEILLTAGADVNAEVEAGLTPLKWAVCANHPHLVEFLLANGANRGN